MIAIEDFGWKFRHSPAVLNGSPNKFENKRVEQQQQMSGIPAKSKDSGYPKSTLSSFLLKVGKFEGYKLDMENSGDFGAQQFERIPCMKSPHYFGKHNCGYH